MVDAAYAALLAACVGFCLIVSVSLLVMATRLRDTAEAANAMADALDEMVRLQRRMLYGNRSDNGQK